jgi:hypothetical protein
MQAFSSFAPAWRRPVWVFLLVAASVAFSLGLACAMPFAALCAVAACTLPRRDSFWVAGAAWAANQVIGFGFLHYPWTANSVAWGAALGLSTVLCTLAALWVRRQSIDLHPLVGSLAAFAAAFAAFEAATAASSFVLGGTEDYTPTIVATVFGINVIAWVGLCALNWAGTFVGLAYSPLSLARSTK